MFDLGVYCCLVMFGFSLLVLRVGLYCACGLCLFAVFVCVFVVGCLVDLAFRICCFWFAVLLCLAFGLGYLVAALWLRFALWMPAGGFGF